MRKTDDELRSARLSLNTPDGFVISKSVVGDLIDEVLELRAETEELKRTNRQLNGRVAELIGEKSR